jgi:hypothetical protein
MTKHPPIPPSPQLPCSGAASGSVTIAGLIMAMVAVAMVATYMRFSAHDVRMTRLTIDTERTAMMAEAGLDHGVMQLRDIVLDYQLSPTITQGQLQSQINAIQPPPGVDEYQYLTPDGDVAFNIEIASDIQHGTLTNGTFRNYEGAYQVFVVTSGCINTNNGRGTVMQQVVQAVSLSLIRFGVFYSRDLEILPGATMNFHGPVHSNGDLYLGGPVSFYQRITSAGYVYHRRKDQPHVRLGDARIANGASQLLYMRDGGVYYDSEHPTWTSTALSRWQGQIQTMEHGVSDLAPPINPMDDPFEIIQRPRELDSPGYSTNTEGEKFANKAALVIHVSSNGLITATDFGGNDVSHAFTNTAVLTVNTNVTVASGLPIYQKGTNDHYIMEQPGILQTDQLFYDQREGVTNAVVDLYVDQLQANFPDLFNGVYSEDQGRGVVYVTRDWAGPDEPRPALRLRNATEIIPTAGLSFATDMPLYVEGNYNTSAPKPALVAGDAVTLLSRNWQDARSTLSLNANRVAVDTEARTVIMTGNTETEVGSYNGGLENVLRFLENWSGRTLYYRGSIIALWYSGIANGPWSYGNFYTAPTRDWGYDTIYASQIPPGMTRVFGMEEVLWSRRNWADIDW